MASSPATHSQEPDCSFLRLYPDVRHQIYALVFPMEDAKIGTSFQNLLYTNRTIYTDASSYFYTGATFLIDISIDRVCFMGRSFQEDGRLLLPNLDLYKQIRKLSIEIHWDYNSHVERMGNGGNVGKAAARMQKNIERVYSALAHFIKIKSIEVVCYSDTTPPTDGGPDKSKPGPVFTVDFIKQFELLQQRRSTTEIWITDVGNLTGCTLRRGELYRKSLKSTVADLAFQSMRHKGSNYTTGMWPL